MDNLKIWNEVRQVPKEAQKDILGGRLKGKTDINPVWRLKALTSQFGAVGVGWYYEITDKQIIDGAGGEKVATVDINLYIKVDGEWSKPIQGTGGNMLVTKEKAGLYTSDECYKMALTDAISVACKSLGMAADIYWQQDRTKYDATTSEDKPKTNDKPKEVLDSVITEDEFKAIKQGAKAKHGEVDGKECLKDYLTERGYKSFKELKQSKIADVSKYIAEWSDSRLPPDIA
jgi:hypothetical protein